MGISLYIHIPFCVRRCRYCDFISYPDERHRAGDYVKALVREMELYNGYTVDTVYLGGGTPTCIDIEYLEEIFAGLRDNFQMQGCVETNIEANPGTLSREKLAVLRELGVNRLSIGLQSWHREELEVLGRIHTVEDFVENFARAREAGFDNINIDLMFGIPGQQMEGWRTSLKEVAAITPEHISCYSLKIEEGTVFHRMLQRGDLKSIDPDLDRDMYHFAVEFLQRKGYRRYEISNFALEGKECMHNWAYWQNRPYIGLGVGAHSYTDGTRRWNTPDLDEYCESPKKDIRPVRGREAISRDTEVFETVFLGLRTAEGIRFEEFRQRFGTDLRELYNEQIEKLEKQGLIVAGEHGVFLTPRGIDLSNIVFGEFIIN